MSLDVNKIIMSSLDEVVLSEGVIDDLKDKIALHGIKDIDNIEVAKTGGHAAKLLFKGGEPELAAGVGARTLRAQIQENPGLSAAVVAALAAGAGGLALRKKLKKAKEAKENND